MMGRKRWWVVAMAMGLGSGCIAEPLDELEAEGLDDADAGGKADEPGGSGAELLTRADGIALLSGYHGLFDRVRSTCVEATASQRVVGAVGERYDLAYVSTRQELARELGMDLRLKARYAGFEGDAGLQALRTMSTSATTVNLLLELHQDYSVTEQGDLALSATGQQAMAQGAQAFASTCGANYVDTVRYAASFQLLVSLECESANVANKIKASLDLKTPKVIPVDGSLQGKLDSASKQEGVEVRVQAIARGFSPSQSISDLGKNGLDAATFAAIDQIRKDMRESRDRDMGYDACMAGGGSCSGMRHAVPVGVKVGYYGDLPGVGDDADDAVLRQVRDHWSEIESISATVSRAHERLETAHGELRDFLGADEQGPYNVYEPGTPLAVTKALRELATQRKGQIDPADNGTITGKLFDTLEACWGRASDDVGYTCDDLSWSEQVDAADALLASYEQGARILPLDMLVVDASTAWWEIWATTDPEAACREISPFGTYRLPRTHELPLIAPMVADGPIDWGSAESNAIWYDSDTACAHGQRPYYRNDGYAEPTTGCESDASFVTTVLCVPADGPQTPVQPI